MPGVRYFRDDFVPAMYISFIGLGSFRCQLNLAGVASLRVHLILWHIILQRRRSTEIYEMNFSQKIKCDAVKNVYCIDMKYRPHESIVNLSKSSSRTCHFLLMAIARNNLTNVQSTTGAKLSSMKPTSSLPHTTSLALYFAIDPSELRFFFNTNLECSTFTFTGLSTTDQQSRPCYAFTSLSIAVFHRFPSSDSSASGAVGSSSVLVCHTEPATNRLG